jgi:YcxB-like protein
MLEVEIEYEWTRDEYLRVLRKGSLPWIYRRQYLLGALMIFCGIIIDVKGQSGTATYLYILGILYTGYWLWVMRFITSKAWNKGIGVRGPIKVLATDDGVSITSDAGQMNYKWAVFPLVKEWTDYYFLKRNKLIVAAIIPKRAFSSRDDESAFRRLLGVHASSSLIANEALDSSR